MWINKIGEKKQQRRQNQSSLERKDCGGERGFESTTNMGNQGQAKGILYSILQCTDVKRVITMQILGVTLRDDLNASTHNVGVVRECSRSVYALRIVTITWITNNCIPRDVTKATTLDKPLYAAPEW